MPRHDGVFVPHRFCTVASGACFTEGRCLDHCCAARKRDHEQRIKALEHRLVELEKLVYRKAANGVASTSKASDGGSNS